jgi:hypothetical protein
MPGATMDAPILGLLSVGGDQHSVGAAAAGAYPLGGGGGDGHAESRLRVMSEQD